MEGKREYKPVIVKLQQRYRPHGGLHVTKVRTGRWAHDDGHGGERREPVMADNMEIIPQQVAVVTYPNDR